MKKKVIILGGGLAGLVVADLLQDGSFDVTIIEKENKIGGMCKSKMRKYNGRNIIYDLGPHKFATNIKEALIYYLDRCLNVGTVPIKSSVVIKGHKLKYPPSILQILFKMPYDGIRCGIDFLTKTFKEDGDSYEQYLIKRVGRYTYNLVFRDYAEKIWGIPMYLDAELAKKRVVTPSVLGMVKSMITGKNTMTFNNFYYSSLGSGSFTHLIAYKIKKNGGKIITSATPVKYDGSKLDVSTEDGDISFEDCTVISTIPHHDLVSVMGIERTIHDLRFRDLNLFYFLINKSYDNFDCWTFFPDKNIIFNRVSKNFVKTPDDYTVLCAETTKEADVDNVWKDLMGVYGLENKDLLDTWTDSIKGAYPIYSCGFKERIDGVLDQLESAGCGNLYCIGRNACHNYNNMDHTIIEAISLADIISSDAGLDEWKKRRNKFNWKIVD